MMKQLPVRLLAVASLFFTLFSFNACQKEQLPANSTISQAPVLTSESRSPEKFTYAVTVYDGVNPSLIVEIDEATGLVTNQFQAYVDPGSGPVFLDDLKGIARTSWGQFFITTGPNNSAAAFSNALMKVNVNIPGNIGQCSYFGSNSPFGPISDLEFDPNSQNFYGLVNNTNQIVEISNINTNWVTYSNPVNITNIAAGTTLKGFSIVRDQSGVYFVGAANRAGTVLPTRVYNIPLAGGAATFLTELAPGGVFAGGHCGIGFDLDLNHLAINRNNGGLNEINPWPGPLFTPVTNTNFWGAAGLNLEDLSSSIY